MTISQFLDYRVKQTDLGVKSLSEGEQRGGHRGYQNGSANKNLRRESDKGNEQVKNQYGVFS